MTDAPRILADLLAAFDARVDRFHAGDREAVLEPTVAVKAETLGQLDAGAEPAQLLKIK